MEIQGEALRRLEAGLVRRLPRVLTVVAVLLVPWIGVLIATVPGRVGARDFANSWIGLDVFEVCALLALAPLVRREHRGASPLAAAAAVVFALDAYFDVMSAAPRVDYLVALLMAYLAELPLAGLLAWLSWHALRWAAVREAEPSEPR
ncbi:hypothetical protein [Kitasatospora sp. NPDC101183]|uniref:hypothetical protein n=1 Tax=Kitasatospora sp. NPDC101183 TaxID=3364100 RepID=UPI00382A33BE